MALSILDGNQTATTLSTVVSSGQHIPAHTVVSLGATAISDIASAISGVQISGSVTANVEQNNWETIGASIGEALEGNTFLVNINTQPPISGTVTANGVWEENLLPSVREENDGIPQKGIGIAIAKNYAETGILGYNNPMPISGAVTANPSIISEWIKATISGTDADGTYYFYRSGRQKWESGSTGSKVWFEYNTDDAVWEYSSDAEGLQATNGVSDTIYPPSYGWSAGTFIISLESPFIHPISGTVTIGSCVTHGVTIANSSVTVGGTVTIPSLNSLPQTVATDGVLDGTTNFIKIGGHQSGANKTANIVHVSNGGAMSVDATGSSVTFSAVTGSVSVLGTSSVTFGAVTGSVGILGTPSVTIGAISGTVTANVASTTVTISAQPSGALTTRFGSVTTANTAQITTAVTNTSRKYLLAQNISAGTVTIGIGFSPTTTQGIQLTAGAGISFDSFVPTGAVYWLGATTGATWTILEG